MQNLQLFSPAKINLFLHVTGRRSDGYHTIQTAFQFLDFCDELHFAPNAAGEITLVTPVADILPQQNLIVRAAKLLQQKTQCQVGATISIQKNIPMGAGLGGGSSNAATTLLALNYLWQTNLSLAELAQLGLQLGADVPVFVYSHAAWAEGVGEKLQPINFPERWCLLLFPACHVPTQEIYSASELTRDSTPLTIEEYLLRGGHNDLEPVVRKRYPVVDEALQCLVKFAPAKMTGSGSAVFALFESKAAAQDVFEKLPKHISGMVTRTLNKSPCCSSLWGVAKR